MDIDLATSSALSTGPLRASDRLSAQARAGAAVVVNGRDSARAEEAAEQLRAEVPDARVTAVAADLATATGADVPLAAVPRLDILVNNLGIF